MARFDRKALAVEYRFVPLSEKEWPHGSFTPAAERKGGRFRCTPGEALGDLRYELMRLGVRSVVVQAAVSDSDIKINGSLRANAKPSSPAIGVSFVIPNVGPVAFGCDRFRDWVQNLRSIVLTMEALRAVERYGAVKANQHYRGFRGLPGPGVDVRSMPIPDGDAIPEPPAMTRVEALAKLGGFLGLTSFGGLTDAEVIGIAKRKFHPDNQATGDRAKFAALAEIEAAIKRG